MDSEESTSEYARTLIAFRGIPLPLDVSGDGNSCSTTVISEGEIKVHTGIV